MAVVACGVEPRASRLVGPSRRRAVAWRGQAAAEPQRGALTPSRRVEATRPPPTTRERVAEKRARLAHGLSGKCYETAPIVRGLAGAGRFRQRGVEHRIQPTTAFSTGRSRASGTEAPHTHAGLGLGLCTPAKARAGWNRAPAQPRQREAGGSAHPRLVESSQPISVLRGFFRGSAHHAGVEPGGLPACNREYRRPQAPRYRPAQALQPARDPATAASRGPGLRQAPGARL